MSTNDDAFEQRLKRAAIRPIPDEWRHVILSNAQSAKGKDWPGPHAWLGLAAAWILIFGLHLATRSPSQMLETDFVRSSWKTYQERYAVALAALPSPKLSNHSKIR